MTPLSLMYVINSTIKKFVFFISPPPFLMFVSNKGENLLHTTQSFTVQCLTDRILIYLIMLYSQIQGCKMGFQGFERLTIKQTTLICFNHDPLNLLHYSTTLLLCLCSQPDFCPDPREVQAFGPKKGVFYENIGGAFNAPS